MEAPVIAPITPPEAARHTHGVCPLDDCVCIAGEPRRLTVERWTRDDAQVLAVDGLYSQVAWRPIVGAAAWDLWVATVGAVEEARAVRLPVDELVRRVGVAPGVVMPALHELVTFGLASSPREDLWRVRCGCPHLPPPLLRRAPAGARALHRRLFDVGEGARGWTA